MRSPRSILTLTGQHKMMVTQSEAVCNRLNRKDGYVMYRWQRPAPGDLEMVRLFLNTWRPSTAKRMPGDTLPTLLRDQAAWKEIFGELTRGPADTEERLLRLRDDLRQMLAEAPGWTERLNRWASETALVASVAPTSDGVIVRYESAPGMGVVGHVVATVLRAVNEDTWSRLKACPACLWVFYDGTRSRTQVWCGMLAGGPEGRACGTIAKVNRYRQKQRIRRGSS